MSLGRPNRPAGGSFSFSPGKLISHLNPRLGSNGLAYLKDREEIVHSEVDSQLSFEHKGEVFMITVTYSPKLLR